MNIEIKISKRRISYKNAMKFLDNRVNNLNKKPWEVPTSWRIIIRNHKIDLTLKALNKNAYVDTVVPYWEGPVSFTGSHKGLGYLEMTGY